jgi:hypothetical protein
MKKRIVLTSGGGQQNRKGEHRLDQSSGEQCQRRQVWHQHILNRAGGYQSSTVPAGLNTNSRFSRRHFSPYLQETKRWAL